jgi:DNA-binding response OmpR family regulator
MPSPPRPPRRAQPSVLIADDDPGVVVVLSRALQSQGFLVFTCGDGHEAVELFHQIKPSLVVLDIRMPGMDGLTACRTIRSQSDVPIVMLTVLAHESDAAHALEMGADDYVRKPFGLEEFTARVKAVLRRTGATPPGAERLVVGSLVVDERGHQVLLNGVLAFLVRNQSRILSHDQILECVWGPEYLGAHHVLRMTMSRLRQKLGGEDAPVIETLSGIGYRLRPGGEKRLDVMPQADGSAEDGCL